MEKQGKGEGRLMTLGRSGGSACNPHPGWGPSPRNPAATARGNSHNSEPGDVTGNAWDQGLGPGSTTTVLLPQPQLGSPHPQPGSSRDTPGTRGGQPG